MLETHPLDALKVGDSYSETLIFGSEEMEEFVRLSRDTSSVHTDLSFARQTGFETIVVHGFLLALPLSRIVGVELPGAGAIIGSLELHFHQPSYQGEPLTYVAVVARIIPSLKSLLLNLRVTKANGEVCIQGKVNCVFR